MKMKNILYCLILFFTLNCIIKSEEILEDKYYFQLYPSEYKNKPYLFHAYTPEKRLITINSTENEICQITENKAVNDYPINGLSSVILYNETLLIKTCFGPDKLLEMIKENNETILKKNNNLVGSSNNKVVFCYSTTIYNPYNKKRNENIIMTYYTELTTINGENKYIHNCLLFNPNTKKFLNNENPIVLGKNNYSPKSCVTFRYIYLYCSISLEKGSYINSFSIDTSRIEDEPLQRLISNTDFENVYQKPIAIGKQIHYFGGYFDTFLTEYHDKEKKKTRLISSLYRTNSYISLIAKSDYWMYYGINIEDSYISPYLFNHLIPNENDLILVYLLKAGNKMNLIMSRFILTTSQKFHLNFNFTKFSLSNYLRDDICSNPKYIQSIFINSLIKYNDTEKEIIKSKGDGNYYKYQKDIVTFLACDNNNKVEYESKKIIMPQCLNILDEINGKNNHIISFKNNEINKTLDIYNDPNLLS